jgi:hypothetical protein
LVIKSNQSLTAKTITCPASFFGLFISLKSNLSL